MTLINKCFSEHITALEQKFFSGLVPAQEVPGCQS